MPRLTLHLSPHHHSILHDLAAVLEISLQQLALDLLAGRSPAPLLRDQLFQFQSRLQEQPQKAIAIAAEAIALQTTVEQFLRIGADALDSSDGDIMRDVVAALPLSQKEEILERLTKALDK